VISLLASAGIFFWSFPVTLCSTVGTLLLNPTSPLAIALFGRARAEAGAAAETALGSLLRTSVARLAVVALQLGLLVLVPVLLSALETRWSGAKTYSVRRAPTAGRARGGARARRGALSLLCVRITPCTVHIVSPLGSPPLTVHAPLTNRFLPPSRAPSVPPARPTWMHTT
jgi:hypothetical protein